MLGIIKNKKIDIVNITQIVLGGVLIIIGIFVIYKGFTNPGIDSDQSKNTIEIAKSNLKLIKSCDSLINRMKLSNHLKYKDNFKNEAKRLKIEMEKSLGINCISLVKINEFDRVVNPQGYERIIDDLYSLKNQIASQ